MTKSFIVLILFQQDMQDRKRQDTKDKELVFCKVFLMKQPCRDTVIFILQEILLI